MSLTKYTFDSTKIFDPAIFGPNTITLEAPDEITILVGADEDCQWQLQSIKSVTWTEDSVWNPIEIPGGTIVYQQTRTRKVKGKIICTDLDSLRECFYETDVRTEAGVQLAIDPNTGRRKGIDYFHILVRDPTGQEYRYEFKDVMIDSIGVENLDGKETSWVIDFSLGVEQKGATEEEGYEPKPEFWYVVNGIQMREQWYQWGSDVAEFSKVSNYLRLNCPNAQNMGSGFFFISAPNRWWKYKTIIIKWAPIWNCVGNCQGRAVGYWMRLYDGGYDRKNDDDWFTGETGGMFPREKGAGLLQEYFYYFGPPSYQVKEQGPFYADTTGSTEGASTLFVGITDHYDNTWGEMRIYELLISEYHNYLTAPSLKMYFYKNYVVVMEQTGTKKDYGVLKYLGS